MNAKFTPVFSLFFLLSFVWLSAQTHRFIYEFQYKLDSLKSDYEKTNMTLDVNPDQVKFYEYIYAENDSLNKVRGYQNTLWNDTPLVTRKKNSSQNMNYVLLSGYFCYPSNDEMKWNLTSETKEMSGYHLQKATTDFGGRKWTAWFTKDIPVYEGPYKFRGLPGLIFEISDDRANFIFSLLKSWKLSKTYDTSGFIENHGGKKPVLTQLKVVQKKQLEYFNDPLQSFIQAYKDSNGKGLFKVYNIEVKSVDQFKDLTVLAQKEIKKNYNPIELDHAVVYPDLP